MFPSSLLTSIFCFLCVLLLLLVISSLNSILFLLRRFYFYLHRKTNSFQIYKILERDDVNSAPNPLYRKALAYVTSLPSVHDMCSADIFSTGKKPNDFYLQPDPNQTVPDQFNGARVYWTHLTGRLHLHIRHVDRRRVLRPYLQHVESAYSESDNAKLFVPDGSDSWTRGIPFAHPATFENLSVDADSVNSVKSDLDQFSKGRTYYASRGRAWRRSYLLYGPSGTGKTTFAAAMAKHLSYDVYDFDLGSSSLDDAKSMLMKTGPRSMILVEDLSRGLNNGRLLQALDFMDGVCNGGEGRVMVFTMTGEKEAVDPGLLRMDVQVRFRHCDFGGFKRLASNYLGVKEHKLYGQVEEGFGRGGMKLSHGEVGEIMVANRGSPSRAIKSVINALNKASVGGDEGEGVSGDGGGNEEIEGCGVGGGMGFGKEATVREIKKLYGLIRRSGSRREGTMSVEMAAAAAAAAASVKGNGSERNSGSLR